jgi:hypothetical protein
VVAGGPGWKTDSGVAAVRGGVLFAARTEALLMALVSARTAPARDFSACPKGRGHADLFALRADPAKGCITVTADPGRLVIEARLPGKRGRWLAPRASDALWLQLGAQATSGVVLELGERGLKHLRAVVAERAPDLAPTLDGRIAGSAGPGAWDFSVMIGVRQPQAAQAALTAWLQSLPPDTATIRPTKAGYALELPLPPALQKVAQAKVQRAWVGLRDGLLTLTTRGPVEDPAPGDPLAKPLGGLDRAALRGRAASVFARLTGAPHDGLDYADTLLPLLAPSGVPAGTIRDVASAIAYVSAHLGGVALTSAYRDGHLDLALEVVLL